MDADKEHNSKTEDKDLPHVKREGWDVAELAEQGVNELPDEMLRKVLRADKDKPAGDEADIFGGPNSNETPQIREQSRKEELKNSGNK